MPRGDGSSPVELLFGRKQRTALPTLDRHHTQINLDEAARRKVATYERAKKAYNKGTTQHSKLQVGALIFMQNQNTKHWNWPGRVEEIRPGGAFYYVRGTGRSDGRLYLRAGHFLKEVKGKALRDEYMREADRGSNDVTIPFFQRKRVRHLRRIRRRDVRLPQQLQLLPEARIHFGLIGLISL